MLNFGDVQVTLSYVTYLHPSILISGSALSLTLGETISHTSCTLQSSYSYPYDRTYMTLFSFHDGASLPGQEAHWGGVVYFLFLLLQILLLNAPLLLYF